MSWTFTTLKQAIQDYTQNNETAFVSYLDDFITTAEQRILSEVNLDNFRKNSAGTFQKGNKYLQMPQDYLSSFSMSYFDGDGNQQFLLLKDVNFVQSYTPAGDNTEGEPKYYAPFDYLNFIVSPTPNANSAVELHYFYRPVSITTASTGTTWLGTNAPDAMLYGSLCEASVFMKGETDVFQTYTARYQESISRLKNYGEGMENIDAYREGMVRIPRT
jgi:hypothetical protein|tara:strand:+ start:481 stop:1131 length:651 start_codon:yes stop_codon:yes gene_type:complete